MKNGDRIKATLGHSVLVGQVYFHHNDGTLNLRVDGTEMNNTILDTDWTIELLVPAEPSHEAILVDREGTVWTHKVGMWEDVCRGSRRYWSSIHLLHPFTVYTKT